jgi:hypothetical protein
MLQQASGKRAFAGTDFDGERSAFAANCPGNPIKDRSAQEKMLAEFLSCH